MALLMFTACFAGPNEFENVGSEEGKIAGFWSGFLHGIISPITFIVSLFNDQVHFYEVHNNGGWYNFGFILGVGMIFRGSKG